MIRLKKRLRSAREERGITGLETAIVLIAFVVVAAVFAFVVLSTGLFSSERGKETVYAGLAKTRGSMELTGGVIATSDGTKLTNVTSMSRSPLVVTKSTSTPRIPPTGPSSATTMQRSR